MLHSNVFLRVVVYLPALRSYVVCPQGCVKCFWLRSCNALTFASLPEGCDCFMLSLKFVVPISTAMTSGVYCFLSLRSFQWLTNLPYCNRIKFPTKLSQCCRTLMIWYCFGRQYGRLGTKTDQLQDIIGSSMSWKRKGLIFSSFRLFIKVQRRTKRKTLYMLSFQFCWYR